ncbi:MAG: NnrS family protein [Rhodospirillales bacterium]
MAEVQAGIPRIRPGHGPAVLGYGFRPFFFAAALWGVVSMVLWIPTIVSVPVLATAFEPLRWHAHEMLFGFVGAAVCGFLLTAIPNWTGRLPLQGLPLAGLALLWLAGRIAVAFSAVIGAELAAAIDFSLWLVLLGVVLREIMTGKNWRNLPMAGALSLFLIANALMHADVLGWAETGALGWRLGMAVVVMLIVLIGGRIVPSFTRNCLAKRGPGPLPAPFGMLDRLTMAGSLLAVLAWAALPASPVAGVLAALAAVLNAARLARWHGYRTAAEPLVLVLHLGYAWIPIGLAFLAASILVPDFPALAPIHAFGAGAFATMMLAIMTRATLGHTGRTLHAGTATMVIYVLVTLAVLLRLGATLAPGMYTPLLHSSGGAWIAAFALYLAIYGPMLLSPRPDGKPG